MPTTIGQLLVSEALPENLRQESYELDKKGIRELFRKIALEYPDKYKKIAARLMALGHNAAQSSGSSLSLKSLVAPPEVQVMITRLKDQIEIIANDDGISDDQREAKILKLVSASNLPIRDMIYNKGLENDNPLAIQAQSGSRGNADQLRQIVAGDGLVMDHRDRTVGVPILTGYSQGLDPVEYWAASYGARKGTVSTKFATQEAGFFGKQLVQAAHRMVITQDDCATIAGIPTKANDADNVGAVLALPAGDFPAGTILTASKLKQLSNAKIRVRSPITCQAAEGLCSRCAGVRDRGRLPQIGDNIGVPAAQALSERISQGMLGAKHGGGQVGADQPTQSGFKTIDQLIQVPSNFRGSAALAKADGRITKITEAPQGGKFVFVDEEQYFVPQGQEPKVKPGEVVEAGDVLSTGTPNPQEVVKYKGIGQGRLYFMKIFRDAFKASGITPHRRQIETLSRSLINHVRITPARGYAGFLPDDIVSYDELRNRYEPREGYETTVLGRSRNRFLERPVLHYTVGTRMTPRVLKDLKDNGVTEVDTHADAPPFEPVMIRAMESASKDPNPLTRLLGSYSRRSFLESVHRGRSAPLTGTSFVPALAAGTDFGKKLETTGRY